MHLPGVRVGWEAPGECCCGATEAQTAGFPLAISQVEKGNQNVCFICSEIEQNRTSFLPSSAYEVGERKGMFALQVQRIVKSLEFSFFVFAARHFLKP